MTRYPPSLLRMSKALRFFVVVCAVTVVLGIDDADWQKFEGILKQCAEEKGHSKELGEKIAEIVKENMSKDGTFP